MSALGSLVVKLALEYAEYTKGLEKGSQDSLKFAQNVQRSFDKAASSAKDYASGVALNLAGAAAAYLSVSNAVAVMGRSINEMDQLDEMAEKLMISTTTLQEFAYAGKMSGVELDGLATGLKKLQVNMTEAITGGKEQTAIFQAMGVSVLDSSGRLRDQKDVLLDVANVFSGLEDNTIKMTLATKLFGKQGADLIPLLNQGADGIKELTDEAHKLGGVLAGEQLKAAAAFNDNLDRLATLSGAAAKSITSQMLPAMSDLITRFLEGRNAGMGFFEALGSASKTTINRAMGDSYGKQIADVSFEIERLQKLVDQNKSNPKWVQQFGYQEADLEGLKREKAALQAMQRRVALAGSEDGANEDQTDRRYGGRHEQIRASAQASAAIAAALAAAKKPEDDPAGAKLDGDLKAVEYRLAKERDVMQFHAQYVTELRAQDLINIDAYNTYKQRAIQNDLDATISAYDKEIALVKAYRASRDKETDKQGATNKIAELEAKKAKAIQDASQAVAMSLLEQQRARSELTVSFNEYERAHQKSIDLAYFDLSLMGKSALEVAKLTEIKRVDMEIEEMRYQARKRGVDLTADEIARAEALKSARIAAIERRDAADRDPWFSATESIRVYSEEAERSGLMIGQTMSNAFHGAEDALVNFTMAGKLSFKDLTQSIIADLARIQARKMIVGLINMAIGAFSPSLTVDTAGEGLASAGFSATGADIRGRRAAGGSVDAGGLYEVNERGPELLSVGGRDYLMMGNQSGNVTPNHALGKSVSVVYSPVINIDSRSDRAEVQRLVGQAVRQGNAQLVDRFERTGVL